jgi:hypothetical protein
MRRLLVALVVAGLLVVGLGAPTASAQTVYNPPGVGPGNPVGTGVTYNPPGVGPGNPVGTGVTTYNPPGYGLGNPVGTGVLRYPSAYGVYGGYGYGGYYGGWYYGGDSGYTYPSYYGLGTAPQR